MTKVIPSCSMCQNFDSLRDICKLTTETTEGHNTNQAIKCTEEGNFVRDLNVLPDKFNLYSNPEDAPSNWMPDLSKLPKDENGRPLYLVTNRGYERAIPAYDGIMLKADGYFKDVPRYTTYQGQREMVYELGFELAKKVIEANGYELHVLPGEKSFEGFDKYKRHYFNKQGRNNRKNILLSDEPVEVWE